MRNIPPSLTSVILLACSPMANAWLPGYPTDGSRIASRGLQVNPKVRDEAVAFWHAVHQASEGYHQRVQWSGKFPDKPGTTSTVFTADVERRINYFRAICGVHGDARVNRGSTVVVQGQDRFKASPDTNKAAAAQAAAMMVAASYDPLTGRLDGMSHDPDPTLPFWSPEAWNAAANGNLAFGVFGPTAISEYVIEELKANATTSEWNFLVGHRRWILASDATDFATGDYPGESAQRPPTNALYVIQNKDERLPLPSHPFVSYPPAGFVPANINGRFWSLKHKNADFSLAQVSVTTASGSPVPISSVTRSVAFGEPAIIWQMNGTAASNQTSSDRSYRVKVSGILLAGIPTTHEYEVTLFNPLQLRINPPITGTSKLRPGQKTSFQVKPIPGARKSRIVQYQRTGKPWEEGGETTKPEVIDRTSPIYPLLASKPNPISGTKSFNLTFPDRYDIVTRSVPEQIMELGPWFQSKKGSKIEFNYRRGLMSDATALDVEVSTDEGSTWKRIGQSIKGTSSPVIDFKTFHASFDLPASRKPLRIRFRFHYTEAGGALATYRDSPGVPTGVFLDNITTRNCDWYRVRKSALLKSNTYRFTAPAQSKPNERWAFALESEFGGPWLNTGPFKPLKIVR